MPFCPKCWANYPHDFSHCTSCNAELVEENPDPSKKKDQPKDAGRAFEPEKKPSIKSK
jgi:hypothetical protein